MRFDTSTGCGTCGTTQGDHARWCDRNPEHRQYPDRNRFTDPYLKGVPDDRTEEG